MNYYVAITTPLTPQQLLAAEVTQQKKEMAVAFFTAANIVTAAKLLTEQLPDDFVVTLRQFHSFELANSYLKEATDEKGIKNNFN